MEETIMRAKFRFSGIVRREEAGGTVYTSMEFYPVTSGSEENKAFWKWTPAGKIELQTVNDEVVKNMHVGKEYYIDFIPAES